VALQLTNQTKKAKLKRYNDLYQTPFERLKTHPDASNFLKNDLLIENLEKIALAVSDNQSAKQMQQAKQFLFKLFKY